MGTWFVHVPGRVKFRCIAHCADYARQLAARHFDIPVNYAWQTSRPKFPY